MQQRQRSSVMSQEGSGIRSKPATAVDVNNNTLQQQQQPSSRFSGGLNHAAVMISRISAYRHSYHDRAVNKRQLLTPLQRFKRAVKLLQILIKFTVSDRSDSAKKQPSGGLGVRLPLLSEQGRDAMSLIRPQLPTYGDDNLTFDVSSFKAHRETLIDGRVRRILSVEPESRTNEHIDTLIAVLNREIKTFSEFPIHMQRSLLRVATYAFYEADRVIIRQGHRAEHFYLILSGKVVITKMKPELGLGDVFVTVLGRGSCFGDLALMHGALRSATLTCHTAVELLAVGRDDYMDIFMHIDRGGKEPEFINFLRSVDILRGWSVDVLPYSKPQICMAAYFRRDELMCRDVAHDDWIYFIKSGSCWVMRQLVSDASVLHPQPAVVHKSRLASLPALTSSSRGHVMRSSSHDWTTTGPNNVHQTVKQTLTSRQSRGSSNKMYGRSKSLTASVTHHDEAFERPVFVHIRRLVRGDSFGLECVTMEPDADCPRTSLVSCGVEAVLISRRFFVQHLSLDMWKKLLYTVQQYPSNETLKAKLRTQTEWAAYKASVINNYVHKHILVNKVNSA